VQLADLAFDSPILLALLGGRRRHVDSTSTAGGRIKLQVAATRALDVRSGYVFEGVINVVVVIALVVARIHLLFALGLGGEILHPDHRAEID
jgi:hypothetical protein